VIPRAVPMAQWPVNLAGHHPTYLGWEEFVKNQERLRQNWNGNRGAVREGSALLQGIVFCGICGQKMVVIHAADSEHKFPSYLCRGGYQFGGVGVCQSMSSRRIDAAVVEAFFEAASPNSLQVATRVLDQIEQDLAGRRRQRELQLEQARYEARLAQRQYEAVDPDHRLVTAELEKRWNEKLERIAQLEKAYAQAEQEAQWELSTEERAAITQLSGDLPAIWDAASTTNQDRKRLLRMAIDSVQLDGVQFPGQMEVQIRWRTDTITRLMVARPIPGEWALRTPTEAVSKIHSLAGTQSYAEIAEQLNREGIRTAFGRAFNAASVRNICRRDGLTNRQKTKKIPNLSSFDPGQCPKT